MMGMGWDEFPDMQVITHDQLVHAEVGSGPWKLYIYDQQGFHGGSKWFRVGKVKYPREEISFARAKQYTETAIGRKLEVRICDGMDNLVFHSLKGNVIYGSTFWNEANPDPAITALANKLKGRK